jgi:hypothetical protein
MIFELSFHLVHLLCRLIYDCLKIASGDRAVWYVNTFSYLGSGITKTRMEKYEDAYISTGKLP